MLLCDDVDLATGQHKGCPYTSHGGADLLYTLPCHAHKMVTKR